MADRKENLKQKPGTDLSPPTTHTAQVPVGDSSS